MKSWCCWSPALTLSTALLASLLAFACNDERSDRNPDADLDRCYECHGDTANGNSAPPPAYWLPDGFEDAHQAHLGDSDWRREVPCDGCHVVPGEMLAPGHLDTELPAELQWGVLAFANDAQPTFSADDKTCSGVYCHGATLLPGGLIAEPHWSGDERERLDCASCHGAPPEAPHPPREDCGSCHSAVVDESGDFLAPELHINGVLELDSLQCDSCHGADGISAPPLDVGGNSAVTATGVGAHRSHLGESDWHVAVECAGCHEVPDEMGDEGHFDTPLPAELTWGILALWNEATPVWDGVSCVGTYCHGATLAQPGPNTEPTWTAVGEGEADCGTCHGAPPGPPHPGRTDCDSCHPSMDVMGGFATPMRHIDGNLDVGELDCTSCHGDPLTGVIAPPLDTMGNTDTASSGVGAHSSHLGASDWHAAVLCDTCHEVPVNLFDVGHNDSAPPADVQLSGIAGLHDAQPDWDGDSCAGTYCHGSTLDAAGTNTDPTWTSVGSDEAACGTCHAVPPPGPGHPQLNECETCHPNAAPELTFSEPARHIDGVLDLGDDICNSCHGYPPGPPHQDRLDCETCHPSISDNGLPDPELHQNGIIDFVDFTCTTCHGDANGPAPPIDTSGNDESDASGVGAHQSHLVDSDWRAEIVCTECHTLPDDPDNPGHRDGLPAEIDFTGGTLADANEAMPIWNGTTCVGSYCHGATFDEPVQGNRLEPEWTDTRNVSCGSCHSFPPGGDHPLRSDCDSCHEPAGPGGTFDEPDRHIDGNLDVNLTCTSCHGSGGNPAPPFDTAGNSDPSETRVGAHQSHLRDADWRADVACTECHIWPGDDPYDDTHQDGGSAELDFGILAGTDMANPQWTGTACSGTYCHGTTLEVPSQGTSTRPVWTELNPGETDCGSCHGEPPGGDHPQRNDCGSCHPDADLAGSILVDQADLHINGITEVELTCSSCHGDDTNNAPPVDLEGNLDNSLSSVGAHQRHLRAADWRNTVTCIECHDVPTDPDDPAHRDGLPVEFAWGPLATVGPTTPAYNGTSCTGAYCHGTTLDLASQGNSTVPVWTTLSADNPPCDSCHGAPPGGTHASRTDCGSCHPNADLAGNILPAEAATHIDGTVDVQLTCNSCHGSATNDAPPVDLDGNTETALPSVGAHQRHLRSTTWRNDVACTECHDVPIDPDDPAHRDGLPVEFAWGPLATTGPTTPVYNGASCTDAYCHGSTLDPASVGTTQQPNWTTITGGDTPCNSCHGNPPAGSHPPRSECGACHPNADFSGNILPAEAARHIDGNLDLDLQCNSCHGSATSNAPPVNIAGDADTTLQGIGAHQSHLGASVWHMEVDCESCHVVPLTDGAAGHIDTTRPADLTFSLVAVADGATPNYLADGNCANVYCHGDTLNSNGSNTNPNWVLVNGTQAACGTCHDPGSDPESMSGEHKKHVEGEGYACNECHAGISADSLTFLDPTTHVNGILDFDFNVAGMTITGTSCSGDCHGKDHDSENWY